jgi:hypothetical protein
MMDTCDPTIQVVVVLLYYNVPAVRVSRHALKIALLRHFVSSQIVSRHGVAVE